MPRRRSEGAGARSICERVLLPGEPVARVAQPDRGYRRRVVCPLRPRRAVARGRVRTGERTTSNPSASAA